MKVLIIGGTGLISTAITRCLIERGDAVTLYNRGQTDTDIPEGYNTITGNRKDYAAFESFVHCNDIDAFYDDYDTTQLAGRRCWENAPQKGNI